MDETTRPELFFVYGLIVSVIVIFLFMSKLNQLSSMDDIIADYFIDELSLTIDAIAARSGYTRVPFEVYYLSDPRIAFDESVHLTYASGDDPPQPYTVSRKVIAQVDPLVPSLFLNGSIIARDHFVVLDNSTVCGAPTAAVREIGDPTAARTITVIAPDPSIGCDVFEDAVRDADPSTLVQRVVIPGSGSEVIVLAR